MAIALCENEDSELCGRNNNDDEVVSCFQRRQHEANAPIWFKSHLILAKSDIIGLVTWLQLHAINLKVLELVVP